MMRDTAHAEVAPNAEQNNFCLLNKVCVVFIFSISSFGSILSGEVICCNTAVGDAQGNSKVEEVKKTSPSGRMEAIEKHFHSGETRYGLYSTGCAEQTHGMRNEINSSREERKSFPVRLHGKKGEGNADN